VTYPSVVRILCAAYAVFLVEVADLLDNPREFLAGRGQFVLHAENSAAELGSADELIIEQLSQALVQHLCRDSWYEPLERPGACTPRPIAAKRPRTTCNPLRPPARRYEFRSPNERYRSAGFIFAACKQELSSAASDFPKGGSQPKPPISPASDEKRIQTRSPKLTQR